MSDEFSGCGELYPLMMLQFEWSEAWKGGQIGVHVH
jgi:hypothetical protein